MKKDPVEVLKVKYLTYLEEVDERKYYDRPFALPKNATAVEKEELAFKWACAQLCGLSSVVWRVIAMRRKPSISVATRIRVIAPVRYFIPHDRAKANTAKLTSGKVLKNEFLKLLSDIYTVCLHFNGRVILTYPSGTHPEAIKALQKAIKKIKTLGEYRSSRPQAILLREIKASNA